MSEQSNKGKINRLLKKIKKQALHPINVIKKAKYINNQAKKMSGGMTWPEREFAKLLRELKIEFEIQKVVGTKIYDFYIPMKNILFEVDGDYYHGNSITYKEKNPMQKHNAKNDKYKDILAKGMGYEIERVWESDLKKNYGDVKEKVKRLLKS